MDTFRYADVARQAQVVIDACIKDAEGPLGGIEGIGTLGTFYVSVGGMPGGRLSAEDANITDVSSVTLVDLTMTGLANASFLEAISE